MNTPEVPRRMKDLPYFKGLPIPFVQWIGPDGVPDFRANDIAKVHLVIENRLCGLCGKPLKLDGRVFAFIGGPKCETARMFVDPPMHKECARFATKACPFLASTDYKYAEHPSRSQRDPRSTTVVHDMGSMQRPWKMGLFFTNDFNVIRPAPEVIYFHAAPYTSIDWTAMPQRSPMDYKLPPLESLTWLDRDDFLKTIIALEEGRGIWIQDNMLQDEVKRSAMHVIYFPGSDLEELSADDRWFHVACLIMSPTTGPYVHKLEFDHYPPQTKRNDEFHLRYFKWQELLWNIVTVPIADREICFRVAEEVGIRLQNGIPVILSGNTSPAVFPLRGDHVWTIENSFHGS